MSRNREEFELRLATSEAAAARLGRTPALAVALVSPPTTRHVISEYWDTPRFALRASRSALRVRSVDGGPWLQTLKSETRAPHSRAEYEAPVSDARPSLALARRSGWRPERDCTTMNDELQPVFRTHVERTIRVVEFADGTVAELALDRGEIASASVPPRTASIFELEIELVRGDRCRLYELAHELVKELPSTRLLFESKAERGYDLLAGSRAPPRRARAIVLSRKDSAAEIACRAVTESLLHVQANVECARSAQDPEGVHQMRVGVRRLRVASAIAREAGLPSFSEKLEGELRWLWKLLGGTRDADVFETQVWPALRPGSLEKGVSMAAFETAVSRLRRARQRSLQRALDGERFQFIMLALGWICGMQRKATAPHAEGGSGARVARRMLSRRAKRVRRAGRAIERLSDDARHRLRIDAKKLRYLGEFFAPLFAPRASERYLRRLSAVQTVLGEWNDLAVDEGLVARIATAVPARQRAAAVRSWERHAAARERELRNRIGGKWTRFVGAKPFWD